jgi:hypothetical protein
LAPAVAAGHIVVTDLQKEFAMNSNPRPTPNPVVLIGETYTGTPRGQASLLAGFGASIATVTLFVAFAAIALPGAAFA